MNKGMKIATLAVAAAMVSSVALFAAACGKKTEDSGSYTYREATTSLPTNWNPHSWESNTDGALMAYVTSPLVDMSILNSEEKTYQWVYEMATSVKDVTAANQTDLTKYGVTLPAGQTASNTTSGYVFEIELREGAAWENGEAITADDYVYSMQQLVDPEMLNYRANLYIANESELAGAYNYYYSLQTEIFTAVADLGDYESMEAAVEDGLDVVIDMWNLWGLQGALDADGNECPQYVSISNTTKYRDPAVAEGEEGDWISASEIYAQNAGMLTVGSEYDGVYIGVIVENENTDTTWDNVGFYKVDDYTVRYVTQSYVDLNTFMTSLTSNWLVYEDLYEELKETVGDLVVTTYGTSKETTMSYGPYKIDSIDTGRQMKFSQNANWYGWDRDEDGKIVTDDYGNYVSTTEFLVDGEHVRQYMTTNIQIDVMTEDTQELAFFRGELTTWTPPADQLGDYAMSDYLYQEDETYTLSLFFNTDLDALKAMDKAGTNTNGVVVSNYNFRKAMSLAIDRSAFCEASPGYKPAYSLMNEQYYYDIYNDPNSVYRNSEPAMQAICNLYGVEYGEGTPYATLEDAYNSITGYNATEAHDLLAKACDELVAAGLYTKGQPINISIAWSQGTLGSDDYAQIAVLNQNINAAAKDTGFGTITFTAVGNMQSPNPYDAVPQGVYAIGCGAWGGAFLYPFRNFQVYMDPDQYSINEAACWDPTTEMLTLTIGGEEVTMTWQAWSNSISGSGVYAQASNEVKLEITAQLEEAYLNLYYRIPICNTVLSYLLSQQCSYYTENYHVLYGFGGLRLMTYNYTDTEWFAAIDAGEIEY